jgi:hypothetical protein
VLDGIRWLIDHDRLRVASRLIVCGSEPKVVLLAERLVGVPDDDRRILAVSAAEEVRSVRSVF